MIDKKVKRRVLGRGLSALMADVNPVVDGNKDEDNKGLITLSVDQIEPNPNQPRRTFSTDSLMDLSNSIIEKGIIQPLIVRAISKTPVKYQIVAGERRWRAAQMAKLHKIPVVVRSFSDVEVLEIAIIENIQRSDLSPIDEANGYQQLIDRFNHTQDSLSKVIGKSRSHIANTLRLLSLPNVVKDLLNDGKISAGHARALIGVLDAEGIADEIVKRGLNVRQVERLIKTSKGPPYSKPHNTQKKDPDTLSLEQTLAGLLGLAVEIDFNGSGGKLVVKYKNLDQLDEIIRRLSQ